MDVTPPHRVTRTYVQQIVATPDRVFPLLCPVRESWIEGWDPELVITASGVAEPDCVFITPGQPASTYWMITRHEPEAGVIEMVRFTPGLTACKPTIGLTARGSGTEARITYSHTSLGPAGDEFIVAFTREAYEKSMQAWEARINHYLQHGSMLGASPTVRQQGGG